MEDSEYIMEKAGVKNVINLGLRNKSSDNSKMITYFKGLEKSAVRDLYDLYQKDFEIFGYSVDEWLWEHLEDE